ncbi:hypothetical protein DPEC_G00098360 [Dallia pectoralis]|uniref:Uncharacterized protein n=1 Tax=Dallia pectoralis TaxID=75939 RepID=A0ACC2GVX5_DALPE|nr:hypothetical protein DPEC_G00098360 [Dallia pectoralis]
MALYYIVEFPDYSVGIVSSKWLNEDSSITLWPPYTDPGIDRYLVSTLDDIKDRLTMLERTVANISRSSTKEVTLPDDVILPLESYQDMDNLEQKMEDRQCQKDLTAYLGTIEAVRKCSFQPSPPESEIEGEIKVWLRNSRDRAGGRKERYHRLLTCQETSGEE